MSAYGTPTGSQPGHGGTDPDTATGTAQEKAQEADEVAHEKAEGDDKTAVRPIDLVRGEISGEFRSAREIAERLRMAVQVIGPPLGMLRRHGEVELIHGPNGECLWREASAGDSHDARSTKRAGAVSDNR